MKEVSAQYSSFRLMTVFISYPILRVSTSERLKTQDTERMVIHVEYREQQRSREGRRATRAAVHWRAGDGFAAVAQLPERHRRARPAGGHGDRSDRRGAHQRWIHLP